MLTNDGEAPGKEKTLLRSRIITSNLFAAMCDPGRLLRGVDPPSEQGPAEERVSREDVHR